MARFYVREHSGFPTLRVGQGAPAITEVMVIDGDYGHRVVRSFLLYDDAGRHRWSTKAEQHAGAPTKRRSLAARRAAAAALADSLNALA